MLSKRSMLALAISLSTLFVGGCAAAGQGVPSVPTPAAGASSQPVASPVPTVIAVASPSPSGAAATLDVSPAEQRVGAVTLSLSFESPRHMVDQGMLTNTSNMDPAQPTATTPDGVSKGAIVLNDMLHVTNNMDSSQPLPGDSAQAIIRHVVLQVRGADNAQPVPYLGVTMDLLLDGHPVGFGQAVVPMVAADAASPSVYYGNNVRLSQRGMYQVFIRMNRNALLGSDQPQAAQFNVLVH